MTIAQILAVEDNGLVDNIDRAARNREMIARMRQRENNGHANSFYTAFFIKEKRDAFFKNKEELKTNMATTALPNPSAVIKFENPPPIQPLLEITSNTNSERQYMNHPLNKKTGKYDHLVPAIMADLKTMSIADVERKYKLPHNTLATIMNIWKRKCLIPADYKPPGSGRRDHPLPKPVVPAPGKAVPEDLEKQKETILADYRKKDLPVRDLIKKYHMTTVTWKNLKKTWHVESKGRFNPREHLQTPPVNNNPPPPPAAKIFYAIPITIYASPEAVRLMVGKQIGELADEKIKALAKPALIEHFKSQGFEIRTLEGNVEQK